MPLRLFVALALPGELTEQISAIAMGIPGARWIRPDNYHLTLRFIGEVDGGTAEDIAGALSSVAIDAFPLRLDGTGCFAHRRHGALWTGIAPREPVAALAVKVERAVQSAGVAPETRAFHPHITLARWSGPQPLLQPWLTRHAGLRSDEWMVRRFGLYESRLGKAGPAYTLVTDAQAR